MGKMAKWQLDFALSKSATNTLEEWKSKGAVGITPLRVHVYRDTLTEHFFEEISNFLQHL